MGSLGLALHFSFHFMQAAVAEVQVGTHHFRISVEERSSGTFSTYIFDIDQQTNVAGNVGPRRIGDSIVKQTLENALEDAETDLYMYIASIGEEWPRGVRIEWNIVC